MAVAGYEKLPLCFEANQGQTHGLVKFLARGSGYTLFLTPTEIVLKLSGDTGGDSPSRDLPEESSVLRIRLEGGNPSPNVKPSEQLPGSSSYFVGTDPAKWQAGIPLFRSVRYEGVYPGIDLVFYGSQGQLEYDFLVSPGADPNLIRLIIVGAKSISTDETGTLVMETGRTKVIQHIPAVYQEESGHRLLGGHFLSSGGEVGFEVSPYDKSKPLIIDPVLSFSSYLGGGLNDSAQRVALDEFGNIYVTGSVDSPDFPTSDALQPILPAGTNTFVSKLSPDGQTLLYSTVLGGRGSDVPAAIAVGSSGLAHIVGTTNSSDFPAGKPVQAGFGGAEDAFVVKLSANGDALLFSTLFGGTSSEEGVGVGLGKSGEVYVAGNVYGEGLPLVNPLDATFNGVRDVFVAKFGSSTSTVIYSTYLGGSAADTATGVTLNGAGNAYVFGHTWSADFPTRNSFQASHGGVSGGVDSFISMLDKTGSALVFSTYFGGSKSDVVTDLELDANGDLLIGGHTESEDFPTVNPVQQNHAGGRDGFIARLDSLGQTLQWFTYFGGSGGDLIQGIALGPDGSINVAGSTESLDFPLLEPVQGIPGGEFDAFISRFDAGGSHIIYSTYLGGSASDGAGGVAVDGSGSVIVVGGTLSSDFPTLNPVQKEFGGIQDAFVVRITEEPLDEDLDGVADSTEDAAPNGGDGNNDGTLDSMQAHVASFPSPRTAEYITLTSEEGTLLAQVGFAENPSLLDAPAGVLFPLGLLSFELSNLTRSSTTVEILLPDGLDIDSYYKYGPTPGAPLPHWYEFSFNGTTGAELFDDRVVLHFVDGERGDDDLAVNGEIIEPGGPAQVLTSSFFFPQFADGAAGSLKFQSTLILVNTGEDTSVQVGLFSTPDGDPMTLTLGQLGPDSVFEFGLGEGESVSLQTPGQDRLQVGYVRVFADEGVGGVVVFQRTDLTTGVTLYEAGVPASKELTEFSIFVDSLGVRDTGFAIVYPPLGEGVSPAELADATLTVRLYDKQFNLIAEKTLGPLSPGRHIARFVYELFDDLEVKSQAQEMEGILTVESDQPLVAVTIRQNDHPGQEFPQEVPLLTTFPVIPGVPE